MKANDYQQASELVHRRRPETKKWLAPITSLWDSTWVV